MPTISRDPTLPRPLLSGLLLLLTATSCATIASSSDTPLHIDSNAVGANVRVLDRDQRPVFEGRAPCTVEVDNASGYLESAKYTVEVAADGYQPRTVTVEADVDVWYFGNVFIPGGLIGSLLIDPLSGAMFQFDTTDLVVDLDVLVP